MIEYMLTTVDNPFNPFTQFEEWYAFDTKMGYDTSGILARVIITSDELSESDQALAHLAAIDQVVDENPLGIHRKVRQSDFET